MTESVETRPGKARVLLIDDDAELCELLALRLEHHGYEVRAETEVPDALARFASEKPDAVLLDLRLRDADGLEVLTELRARAPEVPVLMLTAHGSIESAVEAMKRGAAGFLTKPFHNAELLEKVAQAVDSGARRRELAGLKGMLGAAGDTGLVGASKALARVREVIARVGATEASVLITGESGTGKELAARALHGASSRARGPFVALNCGALPSELLESELFGHVRGAFTGATREREGLFGAARGGTLLLDEIGDAPHAVQVKLLRVLQERRFTRVGSTDERETDVRVLAATNRDLRADVAAGRFREDLFFRLHVIPLAMPPLRERPEDLPLLAELLLARASARHGVPAPRLSRAALDALAAYHWPGNVRELGNVMEGALLLAGSDELLPSHLAGLVAFAPVGATVKQAANALPSAPGAAQETLPPLKEARDSFERAYLTEVLRRSGGSVSVAARLAGRNRTDFYELLRRHGVSPSDFKE